MSENRPEHTEVYKQVIKKLINLIILLIFIIVVLFVLLCIRYQSTPVAQQINPRESKPQQPSAPQLSWQVPDTLAISSESNATQIYYGRELVLHTARYFGPHGKVAAITNGLNCRNCHPQGGTTFFGNNYMAVAATYPKFRERSGTVETIYTRVSDCFRRSLNGRAPDSTSEEMKAINAYLLWLGKNVPKGEKPEGAGLKDLTYLNRAADTAKGKLLYAVKCKSCHMDNGEGKTDKETAYKYPPLWGPHSYNSGAGLHRLSKLAAFIKYNMPEGASYDKPGLSDEEAWDLAAFINSQARPKMNVSGDWPDISKKPVDYPYGPYDDHFSEAQHKYGPFQPIVNARKK